MRIENWFKHDLNSRGDRKMINFIDDTGGLGYGVFWIIVEMLYDENSHCMPKDFATFRAIGKNAVCHPDKVAEIINKAVEHGLWKTFEEGGVEFFHSPKVDIEAAERGNAKTILSEKRSDAGKRGAEARWGKREQLEQPMAKANGKMANMARGERGEEIEESRERESKRGPAGSRPKAPPGFRDSCVQYGEYKHVWLTIGEYDDLCSKYSRNVIESKITSLDANIENGLKKYIAFKNHAACIRGWCSSDRANGRLKQADGLPDGFSSAGKGLVKGPDGKLYQESFLRSCNFMTGGMQSEQA